MLLKSEDDNLKQEKSDELIIKNKVIYIYIFYKDSN